MVDRALLCVALAAALMTSGEQALKKPEVPDTLKVPADQQLVLVAHAKGVQIYARKKDPQDHYAWAFQGPRADLFDGTGKQVGKHYAEPAGPAWELADGSKINGKKVAAHEAKNAIPWLLLAGGSGTGNGLLSSVKSIQRLNTTGGTEPASGCDGSRAGTEAEVQYPAHYYFYATAK